MSEQKLKDRTISGVGWSAADAFLGKGVTFIVGIVLARLLTPSEYGLIGICTIFVSVLSVIVDSGFSSALIRKKEVSEGDYSTMFVLNILLSVFLYFLLFLCSPYLASFFGHEELIELIRVMGLILIIQALSIVQVTELSRRIDFKTKTKASLLSSIISGIVGIGMAYYGYGVWSLVGQQVSRQLIYTVDLWFLNKWKLSLRFNKASFNYMFGFGWKLAVSGLLNSIWNQLYQIVVGKFYNAETLGQYTRSREYASLFSENFSLIIQRVSYPVLSKLQDEKERMLFVYRKVIKLSMFVTAICMIFMGAISEPLIYCLIGPQWNEAAKYLPLICISLSLYPLHAINLNMLQIQGRSDIFLFLEIIKKLIAIGPICLGIFVNIYWMLIGSIITGVISFFLNNNYTGKKLGYTSLKQLRDISTSYGIAVVVAISVYFFKYLPLSYWIILLIQIIVGVFIFFAICELARPTEYLEIKEIIFNYSKKILKK